MFMKKQNKKRGFTITELVVVISVIAILSAVLIPTFSGIINRSKMSADEQAVRNMNTVLSTVLEENPTYNNIADALDENGYNVMAKDSWNPSYKGYKAYWLKSENTIVLVKDGAVVYPENLKGYTFEADKELALNPSNYLYTSTATTAEAATTDITTAFENGNDVKLTNKVDGAVTINKTVSIQKGTEVTVDLGGNTLETGVKSNAGTADQRSHYLDNYGELTIKNGELAGRGIENFTGATLTLGEGVTVKSVDSNGGACIWNVGGTVVINGGTYTATGGDKATTKETIVYEPGAINNRKNGTVIINGGTFTAENSGCYLINSDSGKVTITAGTFKAYRGVIGVSGGTCEITGGTFEQLEDNSGGHILWTAGNGKINMTAGTLIGYSLTSGSNITLGANVVKTQK